MDAIARPASAAVMREFLIDWARWINPHGSRHDSWVELLWVYEDRMPPEMREMIRDLCTEL